MARVIVILALMFLISAVIFGVTRKPVGTADAIETDGRTLAALDGIAIAANPAFNKFDS